jgi:iron(II)-dependent oxidoreductase
MAHVPSGEFLMGSREDDPLVYEFERGAEQPQHPVYVEGFYMDLHEVTNAEFERVKTDHSRRHDKYSPCDDCPVVNVNWFEASEYCAAQKPPKRLPTEAEWEKAARGNAARDPEPFDEYAWYSRNSAAAPSAKMRAQPVMRKRPNSYGLYDMVGNVREWTSTWYERTYYQQRVRDNPKGPPDGKRRVERGGAFFLPRRGVTTTIRYNHPPHFRLYFLGFRCAQDE